MCLCADWILNCDMVPDVAAALAAATPTAAQLFGSPAVHAGTPGPITERPLQGMDSLFWMTSPGVANNMHFDVNWNYLVHAHGPKRVLLAPPRDAHRLQLYPRAHPSLRSSPIDLRTDWAALRAERPMLADVSFLAADLQPHDVLFIPPFWLHFIHVGSRPATSYSFFSTCVECEFLQARLPPPRHPAEGTLRMHALLHAYFGDARTADVLGRWGVSVPHAEPLDRAADGADAKVADAEEDGGLDLGPTARRRAHTPNDVGGSSGAAAQRFVTVDLLRRSYRATPEMAAQFCAHDVAPKRRAQPREPCPDPPAFFNSVSATDADQVRQLVGDQWRWGERLRTAVPDRGVAAIILQAEVEDLAYHMWGPLHACEMMERCVAASLANKAGSSS